MEFKSIDEAKKAYEKLQAENKKLKLEVSELQKVAQEAIAMANEAPAAESQKDVIVKIEGKAYAVAFGVDGLTKEELANDKRRCADMIKAGTAALVEVY